MNSTNVAIGKAYYLALKDKNITEVGQYFHSHILLISPLGETVGKEAALKAAQGFSALINNLTIRSAFGTEDEAVVIYDVELAQIGTIKTASYLTFKDGLIVQIELFFDARPFSQN
jgi:hypothetical protein